MNRYDKYECSATWRTPVAAIVALISATIMEIAPLISILGMIIAVIIIISDRVHISIQEMRTQKRIEEIRNKNRRFSMNNII